MKEETFIQLLDPDHNFNDDCAKIPENPEGTIQIISTDSMVDGTHFHMEWSGPEDIATKLIHSNLADLISSGARPTWCLLNAGFPVNIDDRHLIHFASAFLDELNSCGIQLIGGDTFRSEQLTFTMTIGGYAKRQLKHRSRSGDSLYITGPVGGSLTGYRILNHEIENTSGNEKESAVAKHLQPKTRTDLIDFFYDTDFISSATDISDGVWQDAFNLTHKDATEPAGIEIYLNQIPATGLLDSIDLLRSGEEYEILFTANPSEIAKLQNRSFCIEIGSVNDSGILTLLSDKKMRNQITIGGEFSFDHFSSGPEKY